METPEKILSEKVSPDLIATMIHKAKDYYHDTGIGVFKGGTIVTICSFLRLSEIQFGFKLPFDRYLLSAATATVAWLIPGIMMEKEYRFYKKEQALVNV